MKTTFIVVLLATGFAGTLHAQTQEQSAYCSAQMEAARSQADILRTPSLGAGVTQSPLLHSPAQSFLQASESVQGLVKSHRLVTAAKSQCALYQSQEDLTLAVAYAIPVLEKEALEHRLVADMNALVEIDRLIQEGNKLLEAQNIARPAIYSLESSRAKVMQDAAAVRASLAAIVLPILPPTTVRSLLTDEERSVVLNQGASVQVAKTQNFEFSLIVGVRHSILPFINSEVGGFGGFTATYNLGAHRSDQHLQKSAQAYEEYNRLAQTGGVTQARMLHEEVINLIAAQKTRISSIAAQRGVIESNLSSVEGIEAPTAMTFRTTLRADAALLRVEEQDAAFRLSTLEQYLTDNF